MSEAVAALNGAKFEGFVTVRAMDLQGMITLRGDLSDAKLKKAVKAATGQAVPAQRKVAMEEESGAAWMSPDELLLFVPYAEVDAKLAELHKALDGTHFLAVNVSDARAMFHLEGTGVREVMAKIAPVDMSPEAFAPGDFRRSRMAQVPAAFWMPTATSVQVVCFRSVAEYAFNLLKASATSGGEVGYF